MHRDEGYGGVVEMGERAMSIGLSKQSKTVLELRDEVARLKMFIRDCGHVLGGRIPEENLRAYRERKDLPETVGHVIDKIIESHQRQNNLYKDNQDLKYFAFACRRAIDGEMDSKQLTDAAIKTRSSQCRVLASGLNTVLRARQRAIQVNGRLEGEKLALEQRVRSGPTETHNEDFLAACQRVVLGVDEPAKLDAYILSATNQSLKDLAVTIQKAHASMAETCDRLNEVNAERREFLRAVCACTQVLSGKSTTDLLDKYAEKVKDPNFTLLFDAVKKSALSANEELRDRNANLCGFLSLCADVLNGKSPVNILFGFNNGVEFKLRQAIERKLNDARDVEMLTPSSPYNPVATTQTQQRIVKKCAEIRDMLLEKNRAYGDSALKPCGTFAHGKASDLIRVRIDDKLSRIKNGAKGEDAEMDLMGYLVLLALAKEDEALAPGDKA